MSDLDLELAALVDDLADPAMPAPHICCRSHRRWHRFTFDDLAPPEPLARSTRLAVLRLLELQQDVTEALVVAMELDAERCHD